ncbi:MAG: sarcosine oxidase subunit gamma [Hyphomicrobiaceae bacterium]
MADQNDIHGTTPSITGGTGSTRPASATIAAITRAPQSLAFVLRLDPAVLPGLAERDGGCLDLLRGQINGATTPPGQSRQALRLGPDEWLILAPLAQGNSTAGPLGDEIGSALAGTAHSIVDITHRDLTYRLAGPLVENVLSAGCALPLDIRSFPAGRATRTLLGKTGVVLWRPDPECFQIAVGRSFAPYLEDFLQQAISNETAIAAASRAPA